MDKKIFFEKYNISEENFAKTSLNWNILLAIKKDFESNIENFNIALNLITSILVKCPGVNSFKYRLKDSEHLIEKIIRKKILEPKLEINLENYKEKITDLIGIRVLHLFKSDWKEIDSFIQNQWSLNEKPVIYFRAGDNSIQAVEDCEAKEHPYGYRSIHYTIKVDFNKNTRFIAEIQVRTIFEEAWSEIDHRLRYPYYMDNELLASHSLILNRMAGTADEFATNMVKIKDLIDISSQAEYSKSEKISAKQKESSPDNDNPLKIILRPDAGKGIMDKFREIALTHPGTDNVYFRITHNGEKKVILTGFRVNNSPELVKILQENVGNYMVIVE